MRVRIGVPLFATAVIVAFIAVACGNDKDGEPVGPPSATILLPNGQEFRAGTGSSCWAEPGSPGLCIDKIGIITNANIATVSSNADLTLDNGMDGASIDSVAISAYPAAGTPSQLDSGEIAWPFPSDMSVKLRPRLSEDGVSFNASLDPGRWIVSVFLAVPQGDVSYGLLIVVQ